ncbi:hypothetical protein [Oscillatoria sp. FACHB-1406]|nr:hypothetical protein [Oscillatoria sp. FACHB-1406]
MYSYFPVHRACYAFSLAIFIFGNPKYLLMYLAVAKSRARSTGF